VLCCCPTKLSIVIYIKGLYVCAEMEEVFHFFQWKGFPTDQVSISSTFYVPIFCQYFCVKKITKPNVTREKLLNSLLYKKCVFDFDMIFQNFFHAFISIQKRQFFTKLQILPHEVNGCILGGRCLKSCNPLHRRSNNTSLSSFSDFCY